MVEPEGIQRAEAAQAALRLQELTDELDEKPPADAAEGVDQGPETGEKSAE